MKNVSNIDLLKKFQDLSSFVTNLKINATKLNAYSLIGDMYNFYFDNDRIYNILCTIEKISGCKKKANQMILNLLQENNARGAVYELSAYSWLLNNKVQFSSQVSTEKINVLSNNKPILDGHFTGADVYFDIKSFAIPTNVLEVIQEKIDVVFPQYNVMVGGALDAPYDAISRNVINKLNEITNIIGSQLNTQTHYTYKDEITGIEIQVEKKEHIHSMISSFDYFKWAKDNEKFFAKNMAQYTEDKPFLLICPFLNLPVHPKDNTETFYILRALARRSFINLRNSGNGYKNLVYRKIDQRKYSIDYIADSLSAILFIDIQKSTLDGNSFLFINPNARNQLKSHYVEWIFDFNAPFLYDDFYYDNY